MCDVYTEVLINLKYQKCQSAEQWKEATRRVVSRRPAKEERILPPRGVIRYFIERGSMCVSPESHIQESRTYVNYWNYNWELVTYLKI